MVIDADKGGGTTVTENDKKRAAHRNLVERLLNGAGTAPAEQRAKAFGNEGLAPPLDALIGKVVTNPTEVDFATVADYTEDQLFELVICAAVGVSTRQYEAGLTALAEAAKGSHDAP